MTVKLDYSELVQACEQSIQVITTRDGEDVFGAAKMVDMLVAYQLIKRIAAALEQEGKMAVTVSDATLRRLQGIADKLVHMQLPSADGKTFAVQCWVLPEEIDGLIALGWRVDALPYPITVSFK